MHFSMKTIPLLFFIFFQSCNAQDVLLKDATLQNLKSQLPEGWAMTVQGDILTAKRLDSVTVIHTNHINAPGNDDIPSEAEVKERFEKFGVKIIFSLSWKIVPKWSEEMRKAAIAHNDSIRVLAHSLWGKYEIESFYHHAPLANGKPWDEDRFEPKSHADSLNLENYQKEKGLIDRQLIAIPELCSSNFSLFPLFESCGWMGYEVWAFMDVYEEDAAQEFGKVCKMFEEGFGKK